MRARSAGREAFGRVLRDAQRAAWGEEPERARELLRLAHLLGPADQQSEVVRVAESLRAWPDARPTYFSPLPEEIRKLIATDTSLPRLRLPDEAASDLVVRLQDGNAPVPVESAVPGASRALPSVYPRRRRRTQLAGAVGVLLICAGFVGGDQIRYAIGRAGLAAGFPRFALRVLGERDDASGLLMRGIGEQAVGDTADAAAHFTAAARAAYPPGDEAWDAATRLARLPGHDLAAADAFLRAYAAGAPSGRWSRIAESLERVGRAPEADRVRRGIGR